MHWRAHVVAVGFSTIYMQIVIIFKTVSCELCHAAYKGYPQGRTTHAFFAVIGEFREKFDR